MVNSVGQGPSPNIQFQQVNNNSAAQQEVRARNEQTQPRNAPAADSQSADQRSLQSQDEQRRQDLTAQRRQDNTQTANSNNDLRRGSLLDVTA
ncbi:MAG: hypothetical protein PW788_15910 [Micavibrio sp.]|nr:hypothetical protein [Micavibrio sp.]